MDGSRPLPLLPLNAGDPLVPLLFELVFVAEGIFNNWLSALFQERFKFRSNFFVVSFHCLLGLSSLPGRRSSLVPY